MRVYIVNQSCGPLTIDVANSISEHYETILITGGISSVQTELYKSIELRLFNEYDRSSTFSRLISWVKFLLKVTVNVLMENGSSIWILTTNPPLVPWITGIIKLKKNKSILVVYDLYPEALSAAKIVKSKSILYRIWAWFSKKSLKNADHIVAIGSHMATSITETYDILPSKIEVIPNWNVISFGNSELVNSKTERDSKIKIVYSGNLGATHDFKTILEVAKLTSNDSRIEYNFVGEGYQKSYIVNFIEENNLKNTTWQTYKVPAEVPMTYCSSDVALITLSLEADKTSMPSKTFDALAAGLVLLAICPANTDLAELVNEGKCGKHFLPGDVGGVLSFIETLKQKSILNEYKMSSLELSKRYSRRNVDKYIEIVKKLI